MDLFVLAVQRVFMISSALMASGNRNAGWSVPEISAYQQPKNDESQQDGESQGYSALNLSIDSGTSSAELSQLHSDNESRFLLTLFKWIHSVH